MEPWNEFIQFMSAFGWVAAICLLAGIALIIIEMFTPGFAAPGISGLILLILGIVLSAKTFFQALVTILVILAILSVALVFALRSATKGALYRSPLVLKNKESSDEGYVSVADMEFFIGKIGKAITMLRPAGTCDFDGVRLDVVTEGGFVEKNSNVKITRVEGRRIVVIPVD